MYNEVITLIKEHKSVNQYGDTEVTTTERSIFAEVQSIGTNEFYQAQAVGMKPEIKFIIADYLDYDEEQALKYTPYSGVEQLYSIIRTYRTGNQLEITVKRGIENANS